MLNGIFLVHNKIEYFETLNFHCIISDGSSLSIIYVRNVLFSVHNKTVLLKNILFVPNIKKKLINVSRFVSNNNLILEFHGEQKKTPL